jgi:SAM-dependent methyltransferase
MAVSFLRRRLPKPSSRSSKELHRAHTNGRGILLRDILVSMPSLDANLKDPKGYLERMSHSLREKLKVAEYIPESAREILDVGCADGVVTHALAPLFPKARIKGIDLNGDFVEAAKAGQDDSAPTFEKVYLREMLARPERFDALLFTSVLHEFYSYGEGKSSVVKALADAYELLAPGGRIVVRDMMLSEQSKEKTSGAGAIADKIRAVPEMLPLVADFERSHGPLDSLYTVNHFLLKYFYTDNWERECTEHYVPVTNQEYQALFGLLGAEVIHNETYCIPYLRQKWGRDFGLSDDELDSLVSTSILVAEKTKE